MQTAPVHDINNTPRLLAKLLREIVSGETFDSYADLIDALKTRASRLHIRYEPDDITTAIAWVESNRELVRDTTPKKLAPDTLVSEPPLVPREQATAIVQELWRRLNPAAVVRRVQEEDR